MKASGALSSDPDDGPTGRAATGRGRGASSSKPEVVHPQPSTSGMNGAIVHAGGRENFLRPDLQRENLVHSSDSEISAGPEVDDDAENDDGQEPEGVLLVQELKVNAQEINDLGRERERTHSGGYRNHRVKEIGSGNKGRRSSDGRIEGGGGDRGYYVRGRHHHLYMVPWAERATNGGKPRFVTITYLINSPHISFFFLTNIL